MDGRQCGLFPNPPPPVAASNNVGARLDCSDWGHWLWCFDLLISLLFPHLKCCVWDAGANLRQLWTILRLAENGRRQRMSQRKSTLILITRPSPLCISAASCADVDTHVSAARMCVPGRSFVWDLACKCVFFFSFFYRCAYAGGGCEAVQSPGRTEWIYKLMEFKASSIDYHYNKQQHTECLIIFRQRFCALSSNSADAVTLSDICLWLQLDGIQKEK